MVNLWHQTQQGQSVAKPGTHIEHSNGSLEYIDGLVQDVTPLLTHWSYVYLVLTHRKKL